MKNHEPVLENIYFDQPDNISAALGSSELDSAKDGTNKETQTALDLNVMSARGAVAANTIRRNLAKVPKVRRKIFEMILERAEKFEEINFQEIVDACGLNNNVKTKTLREALLHLTRKLDLQYVSLDDEEVGQRLLVLAPSTIAPNYRGKSRLLSRNNHDNPYDIIRSNVDFLKDRHTQLTLLLGMAARDHRWLSIETLQHESGKSRHAVMNELRFLDKRLQNMGMSVERITNDETTYYLIICGEEDSDVINKSFEDQVGIVNDDDDESQVASIASFTDHINENVDQLNLDGTHLNLLRIIAMWSDDNLTFVDVKDLCEELDGIMDKQQIEQALEKDSSLHVELAKIGVELCIERITYKNSDAYYLKAISNGQKEKKGTQS